jgi:polysaccharide export outer membrane protein
MKIRDLMLAGLMAHGALCWAQVRSYTAAEIAGPNLPAQKIGPNDLIAVSVYDAPELTRTVRVSSDGFMRLPMLSTRVKAQGLLPAELEAQVATALSNEGILVSPVVTVTIMEYHSRPISIVGAVKRPLTYQATGPTTLLDALTRAEGLSPDAGPEILVSRAQPGEGGTQATLVQRIPLRGLIDEADPELNVRLTGGEEIRVPEVGKIFVMGNIRKPGVFPVQDASGSSVLKILALAEGLMPFSGKIAYIYRQEPGTSSKNEIPIELAKIMERKAKDVPLSANDILYIPDNKGRRLAATTIDRITGFGSATASGLLIWRR